MRDRVSAGVIDGITAIAAHRRDAGIPGFRFFYPRTTRLVGALTAADADVYYQSPAGAFTGITAWFCRAAQRRFVFRVASDSDCEKVHGRIRLWRDRKLYDFGLRRADVRAAQTETQARMLRSNLGLDSSVVNMIVEQPRPAAARTHKDIDVLWLSNLRALKRPELALELARHLPKLQFTLAGGPMPGGKTYYDDVAAAAARLPNVTMLGAVRYEDTGALFDRATAAQRLDIKNVDAGLDLIHPRRAGRAQLFRPRRHRAPHATRPRRDFGRRVARRHPRAARSRRLPRAHRAAGARFRAS